MPLHVQTDRVIKDSGLRAMYEQEKGEKGQTRIENAGVFNHPIGLNVQRHIGGLLRQRVNQLHKALQGAGGATGQRFFFQ